MHIQEIELTPTSQIKQIQPGRKTLVIFLLGLLTAVVPFSIDMYLPGFPDIAQTLGVSVNKVALSLSTFFIGIALGQLFYGPLLDRFGRRKPLFAGLLLYCLTSIGCAYAPSIEILVFLRFIQAIGACSATIASTAMVRDFFPPKENARIFSFLILVLSVSPMLAPTIGSYLSAAFGWRSIFIVLTGVIIIISAGVYFFLPESKPADKAYSLRIPSILRNYASVLKEPSFTIYTFSGALAFASLFSYIASSPAVFMEHFGLSQQQYGWLFAFLASGLILASQINSLLLKHYTSGQLIIRSLVVQTGIGTLLVVVSLLHLDSFWVTISLMYLYLSSIGLIMPNATALAMQSFEKNAGSASALLGFIQMGLGSLATVLVGILNIETVLPMVVCILGCSVLGLMLIAGTRSFLQKWLLRAA